MSIARERLDVPSFTLPKQLKTLPRQRRSQTQDRVARQRYLRRLRQDSPSRSLNMLPVLVLGIDLFAIALTLTLAGVGRNGLNGLVPAGHSLGSQLAVAAPLMAVGWVLSIALAGGYQRRLFGAGTDEYRKVINASFLTIAVVAIACFVTKFDLSRGFFVLTLVLGPTLLLGGRLILRQALNRARARGVLSRRVSSSAPRPTSTRSPPC